MVNVTKLFVGVLVCSVLGSATLMAGGHKPHKGKPFVQINQQLIEISGAISSLQDQVDLLVAKVNTIEERATALEVAMSDLESNNAVLEAMISQNATDIASVNQAITNLQAENTALKSDVASNTGDVQSANDKIAANEALIVSLQSALIQLENGSVAADADLQAMIENNQALISTMQAEIASINQALTLKQNIITGTCPNDQAVIAVSENSIACGTVGGPAGSMSVYNVLSSETVDVPEGEFSLGANLGASAECEAGDLLVGGGFVAPGMDVYYNAEWVFDAADAWVVLVNNPNTYDNPLVGVIARCLRIN